MDLFFPDDHSGDRPVAVPADSAVRETVLGWLAATHPGLEPAGAPVERIDAPSVGASSYRVGAHYVKVLRQRPSDADVRSMRRIAAALRHAGVPMEEPILDASEAPISDVVLSDGTPAHLYVQRFVEGGYFDGTVEQLAAFLPALYAIGPALREIVATPSQRAAYGEWRPAEVLGRVTAILDARAAAGTLDAFDELVREHLPLHARTVAEYDPAEVRSSTLHHVDLHPHNLIFGSGALRAIVDFGGFQAVPDEIAIGFALYKLGRKGMSLGRLAPGDLRSLVGARSELSTLARAACIEITRRATIVLGLHYLGGDGAWDRDVRKQMLGPLEVAALFLGRPSV